MSDKAKWSPEFKEKRLAWLRQQNKLPLRQRWLDVLGEGRLPLLKELRRAYERYEGGTCEQSERYVRRVLRACNKLPSTSAGTKRRIAYIRTCISNVKSISNDLTDDEMEARLSEDRLAHFCKATGLSMDEAWNLYMKCFSTFHAVQQDIEKVAGRALGIMANAAKARNPSRYIATVLKNAKKEQRQKKQADKIERRETT